MGVTKTEQFTPHQNRIATLLKAFAHPARIAIIEHLLASKTCICGDIVNKLPLAQATVSQHLKEMKNAGIICGQVEGTSVCYCLNPTALKELSTFAQQINNILNNQASNCQ